jgi:hypothetical protein
MHLPQECEYSVGDQIKVGWAYVSYLPISTLWHSFGWDIVVFAGDMLMVLKGFFAVWSNVDAW